MGELKLFMWWIDVIHSVISSTILVSMTKWDHYKEMVPDMTDSWRKNVRIDEGSVLQTNFCHFGV